MKHRVLIGSLLFLLAQAGLQAQQVIPRTGEVHIPVVIL